MGIPIIMNGGADEDKRGERPDLAVIGIWYTEDLKVTCELGNLGSPTECLFYVNLTMDGVQTDSMWVSWEMSMNRSEITFAQPLKWRGPIIDVMVNIYDPQRTIDDADPDNDVMEKRWKRSLPNLEVLTVFNDPLTGLINIKIINSGSLPTRTGFDTALIVNGTEVWIGHQKLSLEPTDTIVMKTSYEWSRSSTSVKIMAVTDLNDDVDETDEEDNIYEALWESRPGLMFTRPPEVVFTGKDNASLVWETNLPSTGYVEYGLTHSTLMSKATRSYSKTGSAEIGGLLPHRLYIFNVVCEDEKGRIITFEGGRIRTLRPLSSGVTEGYFDDGSMMNVSGKIILPFQAYDETGIKRADFYLDGELMGSRAASSSKEIEGIEYDFSRTDQGNKMIKVVVTNDAGESTVFRSEIIIKPFILGWFPKVAFTPPSRPVRGTYLLYARCNDPSGIANVTWFINEERSFISIPWSPASSFYGASFWWDSRSVPDGEHSVKLEVRNNEGNLTIARGTVIVDNILDPPDPDIRVRRNNIARSGTVLTVTLVVSNVGSGTARNLRLYDNIRGLIPLDRGTRTRPDSSNCIDWTVGFEIDRLDPGDTRQVSYRCVPILHRSNEWVIGYEKPSPRDPSRTYTTTYTYEREDELVSYTFSISIPAMNFEEGYTVNAGIINTISRANYLMMTNPSRLINIALATWPSRDLFAEAGQLVGSKQGVFGFIQDDLSSTPSPHVILDTIDDWANLLHPRFRSNGYLAILGEESVIPSFKYGDLVGSDLGYANLGGGSTPNLIVGRILGMNGQQLSTYLNTALDVAQGSKTNDHGGSALLIAGAGGGVLSFKNNMDELNRDISASMDRVISEHKSTYLPKASFPLAFNGKSRHMAAADIDGDGHSEAIILDPVSNTVRIKGAAMDSHFDLSISDNDIVLPVKTGGSIRIGHIHMSGSSGVLDMYDASGGSFGSLRDIRIERGDDICTANVNGDGFDDLIILKSGSDMILIRDGRTGTYQDHRVHATGPFSRIASADMNDDGLPDLLVADHNSDEIRVYLWPPPASDIWDCIFIKLPGLDYEDGFGAGNFIPSRDGDRGEAVVIHPDDNGHFELVWLAEDDSGNFEGKREKSYLTDARANSALFIVSDPAWPGQDEIILSTGDGQDRTFILDYSGCKERLREDVMGHMVNKDLIVFRDHGNSRTWSGYMEGYELEDLGMGDHPHIPVIVGLACKTGHYSGFTGSFARDALNFGAGVYIGATMVSERGSNNRAASFIRSYVDGVPIGAALRDFKVDFMNANSGQGIPWSRMYNLYGDPAFGTDGRPLEPTRSSSMISMDVRIPQPTHFNVTGGVGVSIQGGWDHAVIGYPVVPFHMERIPCPAGMAARSIDVRMIGNWTYMGHPNIPPYEGPQTDGGPKRGFPTIDPDEGWFPPMLFSWNPSEGQCTVRIYPFQINTNSGLARFCSEWRIDMDKVESGMKILDVWGPGPDGTLKFIVTGPPEGKEVSVSRYIHAESGNRELGSSLIVINGTTLFTDEWKGDDGDYVIEIINSIGTLVATWRHPIALQGGMVVVPRIEADPPFLDTILNVTVRFENFGDEVREGDYSISLIGQDLGTVQESNASVSIPAGRELVVMVTFDMASLEDDIYAVRAVFMSGSTISADLLLLEREVVDRRVTALSIASSLHPPSLIEGGTVFINGTVTGDDGSVIPFLPLAAWIGDREIVNSTLTNLDGSFSLSLLNLPPGVLNITIVTSAGTDLYARETFSIMVYPMPADEDDEPEEEEDDDIEEDEEEDEEDDGGEEVDDDGGPRYAFILCLSLILLVSVLLGILLIVLIAMKAAAGDAEE